MPGRSTTEAIHLLRSLMEKYRERQRDLHMTFLDLEKAYHSVPRELLWRTLRDKGTPRRYSRVIKDMYEGVKIRVRTTMGSTEFFQVEVGLHQGSAISPYLFTLILDELSQGIQESIPWCMIFADDIVLIAESAEGLNNRIEKWREALEDNGLRVSREKSEYLRCDFDRYKVLHQEVGIRIRDQILQLKESFRYLGSVIHRSGRIDEDVAHRIGGQRIRPAMFVWLRLLGRSPNAQATGLEVAMMRMLRAELDVDSIIDKMREGRLRWFRHVKRRPETAPYVKRDMKELLLSKDMTSDRKAWRSIDLGFEGLDVVGPFFRSLILGVVWCSEVMGVLVMVVLVMVVLVMVVLVMVVLVQQWYDQGDIPLQSQLPHPSKISKFGRIEVHHP
ncbi:retrovirus-related pol polyprotein LINE-1 [Tanacetum coccineum]